MERLIGKKRNQWSAKFIILIRSWNSERKASKRALALRDFTLEYSSKNPRMYLLAILLGKLELRWLLKNIEQ